MILKNAQVLDRSFNFIKADVLVKDGKIAHIGKCDCPAQHVVDCTGKYLIPGLVDIHTHGCGGADACDADAEGLKTISITQGKAGITSVCATTMTVPREELIDIFTTIGKYMKGEQHGATIIGVHMEGPFFCESKKGAQRGDCLLNPNVELFDELNALCDNTIKVVDLAPELDGAVEFIKAVKDRTVISLGHTNCDYAIAMEAIQNGASHITHLYNAMNPISHRSPGVIGAASDTDVFPELICDGVHIDAPCVRLAFKAMKDRVCLISDSMRACGMPNGEYTLGGQKVIMKDKVATLVDGTIAGSATNVADCMRKAVEFGIELTDAIKAATFNPAKSINMEHQIGSIAVGLDADLIVMNSDLEFEQVYFKGETKTL